MTPGADRPRVAGILALVQVLFGVHYYAAKIVLSEIPPLAWTAIRVTGAAVFLLPLALLVAGRKAVPGGGDILRLAGLSVLGVIINQLCFVQGLARTTLSHSALINCSIPVLTLVFALLLGQESAAPRKLLSIALALAGVLALLRVDRMVWDTVTTGDLLTLANACSFSLFLVLSRPVLARLDAFVATGVLFACGSLGMLALGGRAVAAVDPAALSLRVWGWGLYTILGATVLAYSLNYIALRRVESSMVALFIFMQPLLATTLDIWLLGGTWSLRLALAARLPEESDGEALHALIYEVIQSRPAPSPSPFFAALYRAFTGKDRGPRAGHFLAALPTEFVRRRLREAARAAGEGA